MRGVCAHSASYRCRSPAHSNSKCLMSLLHRPSTQWTGVWGPSTPINAWTLRRTPAAPRGQGIAALATSCWTSPAQEDTGAVPAACSTGTRPARELTRRIRATRSPGELAHLWHCQQARFNHIHVSAALSQLHRLLVQPQSASQLQDVYDLGKQLLKHGSTLLDTMGPRELATSLWSAARLEAPVDASLLSSYTHAVTAQLLSFNSQDIGMTVWALARMGHHPGHAWLTTVTDHLNTRMHNLDAQAMVNLIWALNVLQFQPSSDWLTTFTHHLHHHLAALTPQGHATCLWALASVGQPCTPAWASIISRLLQSDSYSFGPQELSMLMLSVGKAAPASRRLPGQPHPRTILSTQALEQAAHAAAERMRELSCDQACSLLWGMAHVGYKPGAHFVQAFFHHTQPILHTADAPTLSNMVLALQRLMCENTPAMRAGQLGVSAKQPLVQAVVDTTDIAQQQGWPSQAALAHTSPAQHRNCTSREHVVPAAWSAAFLDATCQHLPTMDIKTRAMCAYSCALLSIIPGAVWQHVFFTTTQPALEAQAVPAVELMCMAVALARWRSSPPAMWTCRFMQAFHHSLSQPDSSPAHSSRTLLALAQLRVSPDAHTAQHIRQQFESRADEVSARDVQLVARAALLAPHLDLAWAQNMTRS